MFYLKSFYQSAAHFTLMLLAPVVKGLATNFGCLGHGLRQRPLNSPCETGENLGAVSVVTTGPHP